MLIIVAVVVALAATVAINFKVLQSGSSAPSIQPLSSPSPSTSPPTQVCKGSSASCLEGIVTKIVDGDTLDIDNTRIRLALVNTPEIGQEGYEEAKLFTSKMCPVGSRGIADEDDSQTEGSYGRMIAKVTCETKNLNEELVNEGLAVILTRFCDKSEFQSEGWARAHGC